MNRSSIIQRIKINKPEAVPLPDLSVFQHEVSETDMIADFIRVSIGNVSNVVNAMSSEVPFEVYLKEFLIKNYGDTFSFYDAYTFKSRVSSVDFRNNTVDLFIGEAKIGVAENGCLWFDDSILNQRIAAFACEHTLLIIDHKNIVPTMHQAYQHLEISESGYGVFIAGPSKTADIEQSLVVGAQGAVSNTIMIK